MKTRMLLLGALLLSSAAMGMGPTCAEFTAMGNPVTGTMEQVAFSKPTTRQWGVYQPAIARHVGDVAMFSLSSRARALKRIEKTPTLGFGWLLRETMSMTRTFCYLHPERDMEDVAFEQVDYMIDAVAAKM